MSRLNGCLLLTLSFLTLWVELGIFQNLTAQAEPLAISSPNATLNPPKGDTPDDTAGGSSRDGGFCVQDEIREGLQGFQVLVPADMETHTKRPTFSLYIPQTTAQSVLFSLKDAEETYYYQALIPLPNTSGEMKFQLPTDAPAMETNKEYTWSFGLMCNHVIDPNNPSVMGVIRRVEVNPITGNPKF
jgi:hypothetical protein